MEEYYLIFFCEMMLKQIDQMNHMKCRNKINPTSS